jgi:hypothetical protein
MLFVFHPASFFLGGSHKVFPGWSAMVRSGITAAQCEGLPSGTFSLSAGQECMKHCCWWENTRRKSKKLGMKPAKWGMHPSTVGMIPSKLRDKSSKTLG